MALKALVFLLVIFFVYSYSEEWEDPFQMIDKPVTDLVESCDEVREELSKCKRQRQRMTFDEDDTNYKIGEEVYQNQNDQKVNSNAKHSKKENGDVLTLYAKKILRLLNDQLCNNQKFPGSKTFQSTFTLSSTHCTSLADPFSSPQHLNNIYNLLEDIFNNLKPPPRYTDASSGECPDGGGWRWGWSSFKVDNTVIIVAMAPLCLWLFAVATNRLLHFRLPLMRVFLCMFFLLFIISIPWNWWHLYKKELAERRYKVMGSVPKECDRNSWKAWARSFVSFESSECRRYYEAVEIDPVWEVSPSKAVTVTITNLVLDPLEQLGSSLSRFMRLLLGDLPLFLQPVALAIIIFVFVFSILILCKYRFKSLLFSIEPTRTGGSFDEVRTLKNELSRVRKCLSCSQLNDEAGINNHPSTPTINLAINFAAGDAQEYNVVNKNHNSVNNKNNNNNNENNKHSVSSSDMESFHDCPILPSSSSSPSSSLPISSLSQLSPLSSSSPPRSSSSLKFNPSDN